MAEQMPVAVPVLNYARPASVLADDVRREGSLVVKPIGRTLPERCVRCNEPATRSARMTFHYHPSLRLVTRTTFRNIAVPLCPAHLAESRWRHLESVIVRTAGTLIFWGGFAAIANAAPTEAVAVTLIGGVLLFYMGELISRARTGLSLARATRTHLYFKSAGEPYLASLPDD